jgi:RsiW-degrading membrane proteinase PrsW (M82 family)
MVPILVVLWFAGWILAIYLGMQLLCWIKRQRAEEWPRLRQVIVMLHRILEFFEEVCDGCKKSCMDHRKLILRAFFWGCFIAGVSALVYFATH